MPPGDHMDKQGNSTVYSSADELARQLDVNLAAIKPDCGRHDSLHPAGKTFQSCRERPSQSGFAPPVKARAVVQRDDLGSTMAKVSG
jgi:hypothetical protein